MESVFFYRINGNGQKMIFNSTYRNRSIDAIYNMNRTVLDQEADYEVR